MKFTRILRRIALLLGATAHKCPSCGWYGGSHKYNCPRAAWLLEESA